MMKPVDFDGIDVQYLAYLESDRWKEKARKRLEIDKHRCCMCGSAGTPANRLEIHHLTYHHLYNEDVYTDLLTLCHSCHKAIHKAMERKTSESGRRGWKDARIPQVHVFSLSGTDQESIEVYDDPETVPF